MNKRKIIRFTDGMGRPLFDLPDGEFLLLEYGNGDRVCVLCGYFSEEQVKLDGRCVDIRQFAADMERSGIAYGPMR